jgi:hypothetical protein
MTDAAGVTVGGDGRPVVVVAGVLATALLVGRAPAILLTSSRCMHIVPIISDLSGGLSSCTATGPIRATVPPSVGREEYRLTGIVSNGGS